MDADCDRLVQPRVPDDFGRAKADPPDRSRMSGAVVCQARPSRSHAFRPWARVHRKRRQGLAGEHWCQDAHYRTGQSLGERLQRVPQQQASRRAAKW